MASLYHWVCWATPSCTELCWETFWRVLWSLFAIHTTAQSIRYLSFQNRQVTYRKWSQPQSQITCNIGAVGLQFSSWKEFGLRVGLVSNLQHKPSEVQLMFFEGPHEVWLLPDLGFKPSIICFAVFSPCWFILTALSSVLGTKYFAPFNEVSQRY